MGLSVSSGLRTDLPGGLHAVHHHVNSKLNNGGSFLLSMQEKEEIKNKWMHKIAEESKQMKKEEVKHKTETPKLNNGGSFLLSMQEKEEIKNKWMHKIAEESKQMKK